MSFEERAKSFEYTVYNIIAEIKKCISMLEREDVDTKKLVCIFNDMLKYMRVLIMPHSITQFKETINNLYDLLHNDILNTVIKIELTYKTQEYIAGTILFLANYVHNGFDELDFNQREYLEAFSEIMKDELCSVSVSPKRIKS